MTSTRTQGRIAGAIYLGVVITGVFSLLYAPGQLFVEGDAAASATAIARKPWLFQASIGAGLAMLAFFLALPFALARFLSAYGRTAARLMIAFVVLSLPFSLLALAQHFELSRLVAAGAAAPDAVETRLEGHDRWMGVASIFWGLWLAPLGLLILRSGAVPRVLGALVLVGFVSYVADYFGPLAFAAWETVPGRDLASTIGGVGEIGTCLWLLAFGARERAGACLTARQSPQH